MGLSVVKDKFDLWIFLRNGQTDASATSEWLDEGAGIGVDQAKIGQDAVAKLAFPPGYLSAPFVHPERDSCAWRHHSGNSWTLRSPATAHEIRGGNY